MEFNRRGVRSPSRTHTHERIGRAFASPVNVSQRCRIHCAVCLSLVVRRLKTFVPNSICGRKIYRSEVLVCTFRNTSESFADFADSWNSVEKSSTKYHTSVPQSCVDRYFSISAFNRTIIAEAYRCFNRSILTCYASVHLTSRFFFSGC